MAERITFYTDVHVPLAVTEAMRRRGIDVLTAQEAKKTRAEDGEHLAFATASGRVLVTQDADFLRLNAAGVARTGIAYARQGTSISRLVQSLVATYMTTTREEMINRVEFL